MAPTAAPINPLLDKLDYMLHPRPFKNPHYKGLQRRNKNLKQMVADNFKPTAGSGASTPLSTEQQQQPPPTSMPLPDGNAMQATYQNIESPPSLKRGNKWCDITGMPAKYTDPKTKLRYVDGEIFRAARGLPAGGAEKYLEVRGANVVLK